MLNSQCESKIFLNSQNLLLLFFTNSQSKRGAWVEVTSSPSGSPSASCPASIKPTSSLSLSALCVIVSPPLSLSLSRSLCVSLYWALQRGSSTPSDVTSPMASHWRRAYLCGGWAQIKCTIWLSPLQTARINKPALQLCKAAIRRWQTSELAGGKRTQTHSLNSGVSTFFNLYLYVLL